MGKGCVRHHGVSQADAEFVLHLLCAFSPHIHKQGIHGHDGVALAFRQKMGGPGTDHSLNAASGAGSHQNALAQQGMRPPAADAHQL